MLAEWFLILTIFTGRTSAAIESVPMASQAACEVAGKAWQEQIQAKSSVMGTAAHFHCVSSAVEE